MYVWVFVFATRILSKIVYIWEFDALVPITYKSVGVDISSIKKSQKRIGRIISGTHKSQSTAKVEHGFGHYAGIVKIHGGSRIATHTDGVGTKVLIANALKQYDTVGIDCVAMNVNDIICTGATPISFVNYIAANQNDTEKFADIVKGLASGAKKGMVPIVGGETAIMPGLFGCKKNTNKFEFDLAGTVVGVLPLKKNVMGDCISANDVIIGAHSTGIHSNGYTLAREALKDVSLDSKLYRGGPTFGDALLKPTEIYVKPVLDALNDRTVSIHGLAHITGGAFTKLQRLNTRVGFKIDHMPQIPSIIKAVMEHGKISLDEMYRTFNMGVGFCVIAPVESSIAIKKTFSKYRIKTTVIGKITKKSGVTVNSIKIT